MNSLSQDVKDRFQAKFKSPPAQNLECVEENVDDTNIFIICKRHCVITNSKKKSICYYYFDLFNR